MMAPTALRRSEDIILLAMEIETLDAAGALDSAADEQVLDMVDRYGATAAVAGLMLTLFLRRGPTHSAALWRQLPIVSRNNLARLMLRLQPQVAARSLGALNLRDSLSAAADAHFHDIVARALATTVVVKSEICLTAMLPRARDELAVVLAERVGRETEEVPVWILQLPDRTQRRAKIAMAFGALIAGRGGSFEALAAGFTENNWQTMMAMAQERAVDLGSPGIAMLLANAPASVRVPAEASKQRRNPEIASSENPDPRLDNRSTSNIQGELMIDALNREVETDAERAAAIVASAPAADANELASLMAKARDLLKPTWRNEAHCALFQRALAIGAKGIGMRAGLSHAEIGSIVVVQRLASGETGVLRRRAWGHVRADQRFTLLMQLMANLEKGHIIPTEARLDNVVTAVLGMADATRDVLALHLVTHLGQFPAMTSAVLDRISDMKGNWKDEILIALARIHALRGNSVKAQELMKLSQSASEDRLREKALERLRRLLNYSASVPAEPVGAVLSALAIVSALDLPAAMTLCFEHLPEVASEFVVADVIARGRAADAFSSTLY